MSHPTSADDGHARLLLRQELANLTTESSDESMRDLDLRDTDALVLAMNEQDQLVPGAVRHAAPEIGRAVDSIATRMKRGGRLIYMGAGTSGRLGVLDASECPPTFGTDPSLVVGLIAGGGAAIHTAAESAEDSDESGARDLEALRISPEDSVVGLSASGRTPYVIGGLNYANSVGALTVAVACNRGSKIGAIAAVPIELVLGSEFLAGSTRLKAGSAQKMVLNMLSTLTMIRLGKTYGNIMIDLSATNEKLTARAELTVMSVTGASVETAAAAIADANGSVKEAVLAILGELPSPEARRLLDVHDGHLRAALQAPSADLVE